MRATNFEFRFRFFLVALIYFVGFGLRWKHYPMTVGETLAVWSGHPTRVTLQLFFALGGLIVVLAAAIRTWATAYLRGEVVHDMAMHSDRLVADGPYRYVHNPLYVGAILLAVGIGVLAPLPSWFFLVIAMTLFYWRLILREEAALAAAQKATFLAFRQAVPRLLPSLTPRLPSSGRQPQWRQAWFAESFMWIFALALFGFALTLNTLSLVIIMVGTCLCYAFIHLVNTYRQRQAATRAR